MGDRIRERKRQVDVGLVVIVIATIQSVIGGIALAPANRDLNGCGEVLAPRYVAIGICVDRSPGDGDERGHLAPVERQLGNCILINCLFERDVFGLQGKSACLDLDTLLLFAYRHGHVNGNTAAYVQNDVGLVVVLEAANRHIHSVGTDTEVWKAI